MRTNAFRASLFVGVVLVWFLSAAGTAQAHKVTVFAWVEAGQVHTESKFSGGKRVKGGKIEVFDHKNAKVLEGTTDEQGYFAFPIPEGVQALKIVLTGGMGHGNYWMVTAQELGVAPTEPSAGEAGGLTGKTISQGNVDSITLDRNAVQQIVENALDKKLAPLKAEQADRAWGLRDILGGLGYILGLVGLAAYLQYRKTTKS